MVSFSPYKLSAGLAKATGIHKVFGGRVSKPAIASPRSSPSRKASTGLPTPKSNAPASRTALFPLGSRHGEREDIDELSNDYEPLDDEHLSDDDEVVQLLKVRGLEGGHINDQLETILDSVEAPDSSPRVQSGPLGENFEYDLDVDVDLEFDDDDDSITEMASLVVGGAADDDAAYKYDPKDDIEESEDDEFSEYSESDDAQDEEEAAVDEPDYDWPVDEALETDYKNTLEDVPGYDTWPIQMQRLHKLMSLKGKHPLMPLSWARDLVDNPVWPDLFAPQDSDKPVLIHSNSSQFRATKALRALFEVQGRIRGYRAIRRPDLTGKTIERELRRYIKWACEDAGLDRRNFEMNVRILRYNANTLPTKVAQDVNKQMRSWAKEYRRNNKARGIRNYPRVLYAFAIIQHTVSILTIDAGKRRPDPVVFDDYDFSVVQGWLDSGLGVAIPINHAREALVAYRDHFHEVDVEASEDPDA